MCPIERRSFMSQPRVREREISLDEEEQTSSNSEVCFSDPEEDLPEGFEASAYIYSFNYRASTSIKDGLMIGRFRTYGVSEGSDKSSIKESYCGIVLHDEKCFVSPLPGPFKVTVGGYFTSVLLVHS